jgi:hypothetical protein
LHRRSREKLDAACGADAARWQRRKRAIVNAERREQIIRDREPLAPVAHTIEALVKHALLDYAAGQRGD